MDTELKAIEKFWSALVTEDGLASYLLSTFKVSPDNEVKALALLTRVTFLLTVGLKNDRDDSIRNEEYLLGEIIKIRKKCSNEICCQRTKLALDHLLHFMQRDCKASDTHSMPLDVSSKEVTVTDIRNSHDKVDFLFNRQNMEKNSIVSKILALETQKPNESLVRDEVCGIPGTVTIENSQYGSDSVLEKTPRVLEQGNEDIDLCSARKNGDLNLESEIDNIDDASLSPILGKKQTVQRKSKNEAICSSEEILVGNNKENYESELPTQSHINLNTELLSPLLQSTNKNFPAGLDSQKYYEESVNQSTASVFIATADISSAPKLSDRHRKRSLDFSKPAEHNLHNVNLSSNRPVNDLTSDKIGTNNSKLLTPEKRPFRIATSNCLTPAEPISYSPSLLSCCKSSSPQLLLSPPLDAVKESFDRPASNKISTLMPTPVKLSKNSICFSISPEENHQLCISEVPRNVSDIICSLSSNHIDEHKFSKSITNVKNVHTPKIEKASSLHRHKSALCTLSNSKKTKVTPLPRIATTFHSSKIISEVSFTTSPKNGPKKMLRQTTLNQDCFLRKSKEATNHGRKELQLMDKNDLILNEAIEESLKTKETEDMLRRKKDLLIKLNDTGQVKSSTIEIISSDEFENDLFISSPVQAVKNMPNKINDGNLLSTVRSSPRKHRLLINTKGKNQESQALQFDSKLASSRAVSNVEVNFREATNSLNIKRPNAKLNEDEILAQLEDDSQVQDEQLEFNNSFKSNKREKPKIFENSFDLVPAKAEEPSYAYKGSVIRKKSEKLKVEGWECHECKDYFHSKGLTEEQKKLVLNQCSRHRSKHKHVTSTPKGFWNADWDSINERNETQFEIVQPQNEPNTKKKEFKAAFSKSQVTSSAKDGRDPININHLDISLSENKKKEKSKRKQQFTDAEFDAIGDKQECSEVRKCKKGHSKDIERKSAKKTLLKLESKASSEECEDDSNIEDGRKDKNIRKLEVSTSKDEAKRNKAKRKHQFTATEFNSFEVVPDCKKTRKEKNDHSKESNLLEKENSKEKKGKKKKIIGLNMPKLNLDMRQDSLIICDKKKEKKMKN